MATIPRIFHSCVPITLVVLVLAACQQAVATDLPPWRWKARAWRIDTQLSYFTTHANFDDAGGTFERLPRDNAYSVTELRLRTRYNLLSRLSFYLGADAARATSRDANLDRENSALTDLTAGADVVLLQKWIRLIAELEGSYPLDPIDSGTTDVLTNDGVAFARASLLAYKPFRWVNSFVHSGVKYRTEGLATLLLWGVGLEKPFAQRYLIGLGLEGYRTLLSDSLRKAERTQVTNRVDGGSGTFYAYDPAVLETRVWFGWNPLDAWQLRVGYGNTLNGVRAAHGQTVFAQISFSLDPRPDRGAFQYYQNRSETIRHKTRKAIKSFDVQPEKTDPELFDNDDGFEPDVEIDPLETPE